MLQFQYGNPDKVCKPMVEAKNAGEDLVVLFSISVLFQNIMKLLN